MASLHTPVAIAAVTHSNIETAHDGPPDDLFLILGFAASGSTPPPQCGQRSGKGTAICSSTRVEWGGTLAGRSGGPVYGLGASGWLLGCPANEGRPDACWHAMLLPVPAATAQSPVAGARSLSVAGQSPAAPGPGPVSEQTRCSRAAGLRRVGRLVSSNPTIAETTPFVQRNLQTTDFRGLSGW